MTFAQPLPSWALALAIVAVAVLAWRAGFDAFRASEMARALAGGRTVAFRRGVLVALRALMLLLVLAILMRPVQLLPDPSARGLFAVLVDTSRSMALVDADGRPRIDHAKALVRQRLLPEVSRDFGVQVLAFGEDVREIRGEQLDQLAATAPATDIAHALEGARRRAAVQRLAGVVVVSDGGFALPDDALPASYPAPVYTIGVGNTTVTRDRELRQLTAGDAAVTGASIDLTATFASVGFGRTPVELRLSGNGRPLEVRRVVPPQDDVPLEVVFQVSPDPAAATLYSVEAVPQDGEITTENNRRSVLVPPAGRARRVLLLEGAPGHEHSFLKRALDGDQGLQVDSVVRKGPDESNAQTYYVQAPPERAQALANGFPASRQDLFQYDAVVLANFEADALSRDRLDLLENYAGERGGGLLVLGAGALEPQSLSGTVLEDLLPVEISDRRVSGAVRAELTRSGSGVALTADGERHPIMRLAATSDQSRAKWASMPPLAAMAGVGAARPGATVLATVAGPGGPRPLVAVQRYGRGRVMAFTGEASWRWRMMLPSDDTSYSTFWRQATRWLAASTPEHVSLRARPVGANRIEVTAEVRDEAFQPVRDADVRVDISGSDGQRRSGRAMADPDATGTYRLEVNVPPGAAQVHAEASTRQTSFGNATTWTLAGGEDTELLEPRRNDAQLARLAERFGGRLLRDTEVAGALHAAAASSSGALIERDVWHHPLVLVTLLGLMAGEWALRRRWGLR